MKLLVFQFHHCLYSSIVVVNVQNSDHLSSLQVTNPQGDLGDGVTPHQLHNLSGGGEFGVHLDGGQLQVLFKETCDQCWCKYSSCIIHLHTNILVRDKILELTA